MDVRVSFAQFDPAATLCDVRVGWAQFNPAASTGGRIFSRRKVLVRVDGVRYLIEEGDLPAWLTEQEEKAVEQTPVLPKIKRRGKKRIIKPPEPPEIKVETNDLFIHELIAATNRRILERLAEKRREAEFYRDLTVLLLAA